jgi:tetratricopeptide (TPR) repeat protein
MLLSLGAYGMNISTPAWTLAKRMNAVKDSMLLHSDLMSDEDIYKMIALCSYSDIKFSKSDRRKIERKIAAYPDSIVNGDTTRLKLETTLKIAYYEFVRKDYIKALSSISNYYVYDNSMVAGLLRPFDFSSIRIHSKQKPSKEQKKKRLWKTPTPFPLRNDNVSFVAGLLYNMPMTFDIDTYLLMFEIIKEGSMTNPSIRLLQNAVSCHRMDIVENYVSMFLPESGFRHNIIILGLYCLSKINSFEALSLEYRDELLSIGVSDDALRHINNIVSLQPDLNIEPMYNNHYLLYNEDISNIVDTAFGTDSDESAEVHSHLYGTPSPDFMNEEELKEKIKDGIVSNYTMVAQYANSLFGKLYVQCHYRELCSLAKAYEPYIPDKYKADFYNYLALSESSLGLYQQSIEHYDMSLQYVDSLALQRTIKMNKGFAFTE